MLIHATTVALEDKAVLLVGLPGRGKSDVALRLIEGGAVLVSDDQTELAVERGRIKASPPPVIAGLMEVRHVGLMKLPYKPSAWVSLYVELVEAESEIERLPAPESVFILDQSVPRLRLPGYAASTPAKIKAALAYEWVQEKS